MAPRTRKSPRKKRSNSKTDASPEPEEAAPPPPARTVTKKQRVTKNNKSDGTTTVLVKVNQDEINHHFSVINSTSTSNSTSNKETYTYLNKLEESGYLELKLWPLFIQKQQQQEEEETKSTNDLNLEQCAYLIALLVNQRCSLKGNGSRGAATDDNSNSNSGGPLSFMHSANANNANDDDDDNNDNDTSFQTFLEHLLQYQPSASSSSSSSSIETLETTKVQFLIIAFSSLTKNTPSSIKATLLKLITIGMWKFMPSRYRDLELRKTTAYRRRWDVYTSELKKIDGEGGKDVLGEYIPQKIVQLFLSTMNGLSTSHSDDESKRKDDEDDEDDEMEDGDKKIHPEQPQQKQQGLNHQLQQLEYLHVVLQFFLDLLSTTTTRRFLRPFLVSINFSVKCTLSQLFKSFLSKKKNNTATTSRLFVQLVTMLQDMETFSINDLTATPLSKSDMASLYHDRAHILQKLTHRHYPNEFSELIYAGVGMVSEYSFLKRNLDRIVDGDILVDVAYRLRLIPTKDDKNVSNDDDEEEEAAAKKKQREFVTAVMLYHHALRPSETQTLSELPLYPDEKLLWNPHLVPPGNLALLGSETSSTLALPKMNTQFLTFGDYLLRSFKLLRLESAYEIRSDLVDTIKRMRPVPRHGYGDENQDDLDEEEFWASKRSMTEFHGWSRMGLELTENKSCPLKIIKVAPPRLGENIPSQVIAELTLDLKRCGENIRNEWDEIGEHDNLFMVAIDATQMEDGAVSVMDESNNNGRSIPDEEDVSFQQRFGIIAVRGCTVLEVRDSNGKVLSDPNHIYGRDKGTVKASDHKRILTVTLDPAQYAADATGEGSALGSKVYQMLNVVVRRKGKENNFKSILETIRGLMQGSASINRSVPSWLQPVFLGYGDPASASFSSKNMINFAKKTTGVTSLDSALDYGDTFLDEAHLKESFPEATVTIDGNGEGEERSKYRIKTVEEADGGKLSVSATAYPFEGDVNGNSVRFTPNQVKAIRSGLSPGLTMIVGPPGTGKTDVATQIIANLYHSFPSQRTVIVTHSNAALNDLFAKVMARGDIDERYMLRLGSGERDLQTDSEFDFTKIGRVNHILSRRAKLLEEVQRLSESLGVSGAAERGPDGAPSYTCETAEYFQLHHIKKRVQIFLSNVKDDSEPSDIAELFPFKKYFEIGDDAMTLPEATKRFEIISQHFTELAEYRPLELLRSQRQRTDYLLTKQARIVAMTCTHAAIARSQLVEMGFQYDNIVMEEAGQMLDIETFIPLLLQRGETGNHSADSRLKRITLIGDHHQLPPVVKNMSFAKYSNLDQSLFTRLVRLGVPSIDLNKQGRARPRIANLYNWRYKDLGNLDHVGTKPTFLKANTGLAHTHQIINVEDYEGCGESTPTAYFYQNVGEAEYAVALFQYMVLIGYPPEKISILTTYNGQKDLLNDIISSRCGPDTPLGGVRPGAVSTVDHYQGQQNDYVILSLVRTKSIGHLRDIRRLVVAVSRARLGLYVLCRQSVFSGCHELKNVFDQFSNVPNELELVTGEQYPTERSLDADIAEDKKHTVKDVAALGAIVHGMQQQLCNNAMEE